MTYLFFIVHACESRSGHSISHSWHGYSNKTHYDLIIVTINVIECYCVLITSKRQLKNNMNNIMSVLKNNMNNIMSVIKMYNVQYNVQYNVCAMAVSICFYKKVILVI